jgi:HlyD family secretion protein
MTKKKKIIIGIIVVVVLGAIAYANTRLNRDTSLAVTAEKIEKRNLESIVTASGKIRAKQTVNISAETTGKVVTLTVAEGQTVKRGELLLEIDPRNLETQVQNREASLAVQRSQLEGARKQIENTKVTLQQARDTLKRLEELNKQGLIPKEQYERAVNDVTMRETDLRVREQDLITQEQRIKQEEANLETARYDLHKVRIVSPMDGLVTRRNIEVGETAVVGTMNNAGTVLLTIADMSVIETEIEVDETDVVDVHVGQPAKITIDAIPEREFPGRVTEVGNSPIQTGTAGATAQRATNFKVVITLDGEVPGVRPGFTCTAIVTTATRMQAMAVPIQAVTMRELVVDAEGNIVKPDANAEGAARGRARRPTIGPATLAPGQERKEFEGVFLVRDGRAVFVPVKLGITGEKYHEVLDGLKEGDEVITGPFASVRNLKEGDTVRVTGTGLTTGPETPRGPTVQVR